MLHQQSAEIGVPSASSVVQWGAPIRRLRRGRISAPPKQGLGSFQRQRVGVAGVVQRADTNPIHGRGARTLG